MNIKKIRQDFPLFKFENKKNIIYFDNACQTLRPQTVINTIVDYYNNYPACAGRSIHKLGKIVTEKCIKSRKIIANFLGARTVKEIIFTRNATEGINLVAYSLNLKENDVVLTTDKEHNSNLIPWLILKKEKKIIHQIIFSQEDNTFDLAKFTKTVSELKNKIKLISLVFTSNLDGVTNPAKKIIDIAHQYEIKVLLDATQTAPHQKINVKKLDVDFLVLSGHKMLGPSGIGVLYGKYNLLEKLNPFLTGGETVASSTYNNYEFLPPPEKFEAGLQNYAGIIGFGEAIKYLEKIGFKNIKNQEYKLNKFITDELLKIPGLKIIGPSDPTKRGGIISFYFTDIDSHRLALFLDEMDSIMIRSGQHCVHSWFNAHQIKNSARVSLYFYNTLEECHLFLESFKKIIKTIK